MATTKTRINVSLSKDVEQALSLLAKRDQVPQATKAAELLRKALELEEDAVLSAIADERDQKGVRYISHKKVWEQTTP